MAISLKLSSMPVPVLGPFPLGMDMVNAALTLVVVWEVFTPPPVIDVVTFLLAWSGAMAGGNNTASSRVSIEKATIGWFCRKQEGVVTALEELLL